MKSRHGQQRWPWRGMKACSSGLHCQPQRVESVDRELLVLSVLVLGTEELLEAPGVLELDELAPGVELEELDELCEDAPDALYLPNSAWLSMPSLSASSLEN
jgi:hypothetical protein